MKSKIGLFCNISERNVISAEDIHGSIYEIPYMLHRNEYDRVVLDHFNLPDTELKIPEWDRFIRSVRNPKHRVSIAVVGKYISLNDAYRSIYEALFHGATSQEAELEIIKIDSEEVEKKSSLKSLFKEADGILVPGGFGNRGIEGKISAISHARKEGIPFLGICLGMQCAVIEFARNVCGLKDANSTEFDQQTGHPVISLLEEQEIVVDKGGTMRLGAYECEFVPGSRIGSIYRVPAAMERHRHRFEFTNKYRDVLEGKGMKVGGIHPHQNELVETVEITDHPWFFATQYHPEFKSKPTSPHPMFRDFVRAALERKGKKK
jgi:CTP synthase